MFAEFGHEHKRNQLQGQRDISLCQRRHFHGQTARHQGWRNKRQITQDFDHDIIGTLAPKILAI